MALNIYHEARGESLTGQHAVAQVTWNRAEHDPEKVCSVVFKQYQFSWTAGNFKRKGDKYILPKGVEPNDKQSWTMAGNIAKLTLMNAIPDFTKGAMFYHTNRVNPTWNRKLVLVSVIGAHRFYKFA